MEGTCEFSLTQAFMYFFNFSLGREDAVDAVGRYGPTPIEGKDWDLGKFWNE